jgi:hypothetical protein
MSNSNKKQQNVINQQKKQNSIYISNFVDCPFYLNSDKSIYLLNGHIFHKPHPIQDKQRTSHFDRFKIPVGPPMQSIEELGRLSQNRYYQDMQNCGFMCGKRGCPPPITRCNGPNMENMPTQTIAATVEDIFDKSIEFGIWGPDE